MCNSFTPWYLEFSLNYTKLAVLAIKAFIGQSKINSAQKYYLQWGLISCDPLWCLSDRANFIKLKLTWHALLRKQVWHALLWNIKWIPSKKILKVSGKLCAIDEKIKLDEMKSCVGYHIGILWEKIAKQQISNLLLN